MAVILPKATSLERGARLAALAFPDVAITVYHIGDTDTDRFYATHAGFRFLTADARRTRGPELFAES